MFATAIIGLALAAAGQPAAKPAAAKPKLLCRMEETTGSLAGAKKRCMTREDWARQYERTQEGLNVLNDHTTTCTAPNGCQ